MGYASDELKVACRLKYRIYQEMGFYTHRVSFDQLKSTTQARPFAGHPGERVYWRFLLEPYPEVVLQHSSTQRQSGGVLYPCDALLTGAFPLRLSGTEITVEADGQEITGLPVSQSYASPDEFRKAMEAAARFWIDDDAYVYAEQGKLSINSSQSEWTLQLSRQP